MNLKAFSLSAIHFEAIITVSVNSAAASLQLLSFPSITGLTNLKRSLEETYKKRNLNCLPFLPCSVAHQVIFQGTSLSASLHTVVIGTSIINRLKNTWFLLRFEFQSIAVNAALENIPDGLKYSFDKNQ